MSGKYFNQDLSRKNAILIKTNPYKARLQYEKYFLDYPYDYNSRSIYISLLISLKEFDLAQKELNSLEQIVLSKSKYLSDPRIRHLKSKDILFCKIKLLLYTHRYEDLYYEIHKDENKHLMIELKLSRLLDIYCKTRLGKYIDVSRVDDSYLFHQILDYSYERMIDHVNEHTSDYNSMLEVPESSIFSCDFPLDRILSNFKEYADPSKRFFLGMIDDTYVFKFDNCGRVKDRTTDYFKIVCFHDTFDIITAYPDDSGKNYPYVDLNYLVERDYSKVKSISARERFNARYSRK